ncbi:MAG: thiamine-phosphate kinase [Neisseriales bacterium]|nr:MAG: thiamine-phosphate kinase [Neisseriales bacterium]
MNEFELINHFFKQPCHHSTLGIGDDAAIFAPTTGCEIHVSVDTLVEHQHFFANTSPTDLGHKALAINISDIAAMGAVPRWALLSLTLPQVDPPWLAGFMRGFFSLAKHFNIDLIGGDTVCGPLAVTVTIIGESPIGRALYRSAAKPDEDIWVSGILGLAAFSVYYQTQTNHIQKETIPTELWAMSEDKLNRPSPRVALGQALRGIASACIDVSDGLLSDLSHLLNASCCGATLWFETLPSHPFIKQDSILQHRCLLGGGDDYELLFTAPAQHRNHIDQLSQALQLPLTRIGVLHTQRGLQVLDQYAQPITITHRGFDHFA